MTYPDGYEWLADKRPLPRTIMHALLFYGVREVKGPGSNPVILGWRDELRAAGVNVAGYADDDTAWCGLFAALVCHRAGWPVVENPLWARNWAKFGQAAQAGALGDVLVFSRAGGGGHVGFYIGEDATTYYVLGGNQGDAVSIARIVRARCIAIRRPSYTNPPASVRPVRLTLGGALSNNEA